MGRLREERWVLSRELSVRRRQQRGLAWPRCGGRYGCVLFVDPDFRTPVRGQLGRTFLGSCASGLLDSLKDPDLQEKGQAAIKAFAPQLIWIVQRNRFEENELVSPPFSFLVKSQRGLEQHPGTVVEGRPGSGQPRRPTSRGRGHRTEKPSTRPSSQMTVALL